MSPNYEFMDYALSAFITTNIDIVEERLIIIMKEKNACVNLWSTIIDATTIILQAYTYTNHPNFIRQNEKYEAMSLQKNSNVGTSCS